MRTNCNSTAKRGTFTTGFGFVRARNVRRPISNQYPLPFDSTLIWIIVDFVRFQFGRVEVDKRVCLADIHVDRHFVTVSMDDFSNKQSDRLTRTRKWNVRFFSLSLTWPTRRAPCASVIAVDVSKTTFQSFESSIREPCKTIQNRDGFTRNMSRDTPSDRPAISNCTKHMSRRKLPLETVKRAFSFRREIKK